MLKIEITVTFPAATGTKTLLEATLATQIAGGVTTVYKKAGATVKATFSTGTIQTWKSRKTVPATSPYSSPLTTSPLAKAQAALAASQAQIAQAQSAAKAAAPTQQA